MKAIGFDGRERPWNLSKYVPKNRSHSNLHGSVRKTLKQLFPKHKLLEEVSLPGSFTSTRKSTLYADFFIPSANLIVEAHGRQHYEFVPFYHKRKEQFYKSRMRDKDKICWCEINEIDIIILKYSDTEYDWEKTILNR